MSAINVSSASQGWHGDDVDMEQDVMSPQLQDHSYYTPHQTSDAIEEVVTTDGPEGTVSSDTKPNLTELVQVKLEPVISYSGTPTSNYQGIQSPVSASNYASTNGQLTERGNLVVVNSGDVGQVVHTEPLPEHPSPPMNGEQQNSAHSDALLGYIQDIPVSDVPYNVSHHDIAKALTVNNCDKVSVRIMRKVIPCIRIVSYMKNNEFVGKKKIKGLWARKPEDWPEKVPYKDPNNGEKIDGRTVPKANSSELKDMFIFLKEKLMKKMEVYFQEIPKEELEELKEKGKAFNNSYAQYQFNTPSNSAGGKMPTSAVKKHHATHPYYNHKQSTDQYTNKQQKLEVEKSVVPQELVQSAPLNWESAVKVHSIPTFVASEESDENTPSKKDLPFDRSEQIVFMPESAQASDSSSDDGGSEKQFVQFHDYVNDTVTLIQLQPGQTYEVQSDSSCADSIHDNLSPPHEVMEAVEDSDPSVELVNGNEIETSGTTIMADASDYISQETHEVVAVAVSTPDSEAVARLVESHPLIMQDRGSKDVTNGPIQHVSSVENIQQHRQIDQPKVVVESIPTYPNTPSPQLQQPVQTTLPKMEPPSPQPQYTTSPLAYAPVVTNPVVTSPMVPPEQNYARTQLLQDTHDRIRAKILQLQGACLGEVEISVRLNMMYKNVVQLQYQKAFVGHQNNFIKAASSCEQAIDKALMEGNSYHTDDFIKDLDDLVASYGQKQNEEMIKKATVLHVSEPDHPPIQASFQAPSREQGPFSPSRLDPKSPGTALSEKMGQLDLDQLLTSKDDPMQLGIKTRHQGDVEKLVGIINPPKIPEPENDENLIPLPEKLNAMGVDVNTLPQEVVEDFNQQLKQCLHDDDMDKLFNLLNRKTPQKDESEIDIKKQKMTHDTEKLQNASIKTAANVTNVTNNLVVKSTFTAAPYKHQSKQSQHLFSKQMVEQNIQQQHQNHLKLQQQQLQKIQREKLEFSKMGSSNSLQSKPSTGNFTTETGEFECFNEEDVLNDVLGLEESYAHYDVDWKCHLKGIKTNGKNTSQASTPNEGNLYVSSEKAFSTHSMEREPKPIPIRPAMFKLPEIIPKPAQPNSRPLQEIPGVRSSSLNNNAVNKVHSSNAVACDKSPVFEWNLANVSIVCPVDFESTGSCIPEVVENFESMLDDEEPRRPRGRKRPRYERKM